VRFFLPQSFSYTYLAPRVVPFLIIALLLEEVIPLIAIYAPFMLPSTCILPSQRARIEAKRAEKALNSSVNSKAIFAALKSQGSISLEALKKAEGAPTAVCR
jgi:LETM1 and EF-hand domain-containing protein 1